MLKIVGGLSHQMHRAMVRVLQHCTVAERDVLEDRRLQNNGIPSFFSTFVLVTFSSRYLLLFTISFVQLPVIIHINRLINTRIYM